MKIAFVLTTVLFLFHLLGIYSVYLFIVQQEA
ncbi:hypothetical protein ACVLD2_003207 [Paenibacillus sp. PvR052]|nr:hypothetical protein [Paenibacillus sp. PvP091]MBP1168528.1 hypothetical protein [Paenibacillus sp. PvR098]MBP2439556.1 hypothetical protein [Paenibacillus sp. PvP052]